VTKILKRDFKKASKPHKIAVFKSRNFVGGDVRELHCKEYKVLFYSCLKPFFSLIFSL
jgi:hypothetical protein